MKFGNRNRVISKIAACLLTFVLLVGVAPLRTLSANEGGANAVTFGVISDTHIGVSGQDARLNRVLNWYTDLGVDALAIVGDITNDC